MILVHGVQARYISKDGAIFTELCTRYRLSRVEQGSHKIHCVHGSGGTRPFGRSGTGGDGGCIPKRSCAG